jgi:hypothetical protein
MKFLTESDVTEAGVSGSLRLSRTSATSGSKLDRR